MNGLRSTSTRLLKQQRSALLSTTTKSRSVTAVCVVSARTTICRAASTVLSSKSAARACHVQRPSASCLVLRRGYASGNLPPHTLISMPALSPTMTAGNLGEWHKKIGDEIQPGDVLVEVETDKATMDFECQDEGFLAKIFIDSGAKDVSVNKPIAILVESKDDIDKFKDYTPEAAPAAAAETGATEKKAPEEPAPPKVDKVCVEDNKQAEQPAAEGRVVASPVARKLAAERGIDLAKVKGSGPNGRIVQEDVLNYKAPAPSAATAAPTKGAPAPTPAPAASTAQYEDIPLSNVRKVIANRLTESKQQIPHYYLTVELDADKILKLREVLNSQANGKYKLSLNDFVVKAAGLALRDVPEVNSSWQGTYIRQYKTADIAVAVATETGLITPIIPSAETKGLSTISNSIKTLATKARQNKLQPHEYQGGTFTISNLGMYGIDHFTAIINPPHAGILAVGGVEDKLVLDESAEKGFRVKKVMKVTMSSDHRVVDGAVGAKWLGRFREYIEKPLSMLL